MVDEHRCYVGDDSRDGGGAEAVSGRIRISIIEGTQAARFLRGSIRCSLARGRQPGKATGLRS